MRLVPIVVVAVALAAAGCSSSHTSTPSAPAAPSAAEPSASPSSGDDDGGSTGAAGADVPDGFGVELPALGISFAVPDTYTPLDPTELSSDDYESDWFDDLADSVDVPVEQLTSALRGNLELFLFAPVDDGYTDNITVETLPDGPLPTENDVRDQLRPLGVVDVDVADLDASGIEIVRASYVEADDRAGYDVYLGLDEAVVEISVTASDEGDATAVGEMVIDTLQRTG